MHIAGQPVRSDETHAPFNCPMTAPRWGRSIRPTKEQVDAAISAAVAACPDHAQKMTLDERSNILRKAYQKLLDRRDEMAMAISSESGKPIKEARLEVERSAMTLLFSAEEAHRLRGEVVPMDASPAGKGHWAMTVREPVGVIAAITPFNFPLNLAMHKIGPALAGGNTVVHKPASATPISGVLMAGIFEECGLPAGALNVITGPGGAIGDLLVFDKRIAMVTFTGSPDVGLRIRNLAGMKRVTLELGSNSAVIVEDDADLNEAVPRCVAGSFAHSGQVCISIQRIYLNAKIRGEFLERFIEGARKLHLGHPHEASTDISSLITEGEAQRVEGWIREAVDAGAKLESGGVRSRLTIEPTVLTGVPANAKIACREAFGPVVGINTYETLEEAIAKVNDSDYGLQAGIYTRDIQKAFRTAQKVHVGGFMINEIPQYRVDQMPYGGVKLSGSGREGPKYAVEEMTEPKLICWKA